MDKRRKRSFFEAYHYTQKGLAERRSSLSLQSKEYSSLMICGYDVKLPLNLEPYRTQKTMIMKVLTSLKNRLSALIESPTGSGKTLALLSSTCAWLAKYKEERIRSKEECLACNGRVEASAAKASENSECVDSQGGDTEVMTPIIPPQKSLTVEEEFELDFSPKVSPVSTIGADILSFSSKRMKVGENGESESHEGHTCLPKITIYYGTRTHKQIGQVVKEFSRLPYGHTGVLKHTILASREHTCINKMVHESGGDLKTKCVELNGPKGTGCSFKNAMRPKYEKPIPTRQLIASNSGITDDVWDIEDLVKTLSISNPSICPYFVSSRVFTTDADIVFCPFNYMLDPIIRDNSDVTLKNAIIILDEAHNVEDVCRESTTFAFTEKEIVAACLEFRRKGSSFFSTWVLKDCLKLKGSRNLAELENYSVFNFNDLGADVGKVCDKMQKDNTTSEDVTETFLMEHANATAESYHQLNESFKMINKFMSDILSWFTVMAAEALKLTYEKNNRAAYTFTWERLYTSLSEANFLRFCDRGGGSAFVSLIKAFTDVCGGNEHGDAFKPNSAAIVCAEKFVYFFRLYFMEDHRTCYKLFVCAEKPYEPNRFGNRFEKPTDVLDMSAYASKDDPLWLDSRAPLNGYREVKQGYRVNFELWCMRPALAYLDAFKHCRSVILASGTLCPMDTFKSELGVEFQQQMEGSQVIPEDHIFAAVIPAGPNGHHLRATYKNINADDQLISELALVLRSVCATVPKGILCFLASYRLLEQLYEFMETSGILRQIMTLKVFKHVLREPRRSTQMNDVMAEYEEAIDCPERYGSLCTGALMFAVFRGKVSEGIDFADDRARCVISVGIPFPNAMDEQVQEKKRYNDENCKKMHLLSGDSWYTMQAYRALNQALGRCLRHRNDWGVILLVDDRLLQTRANPNATKVSRWIREQLRPLSGYNDFLLQLKKFIDKMQLQSADNKPSLNSVFQIEQNQ